MRIRKLLIGFSRNSDPALLAFAQAVKTAMTGNPNFPTPQPTLVVLGDAITEFEEAMAAAAAGGKTETSIKNDKRLVLLDLLKQLAAYVNLVSNGDESMMLSSGFSLSKEPTPVGPLPKPEMEVRTAEKGQLKVACKNIYGARIYRLEYKKKEEEAWTQHDSTASKILLTNLESGKEYECRMLPMGTSEVRTYSDTISCFVA